jgi:hypothetical protein
MAIGGQSIDLINRPPRLQHKAADKRRSGGRKRRDIPCPFYNAITPAPNPIMPMRKLQKIFQEMQISR